MTDSSNPIWERWEEVDRLFEAVLDLAPAEREPFLAGACGEDAELLSTLRSLLARSADAEDRLVAPGPSLLQAVWSEPGPTPAAPPDLAPGDRVGRYRVAGELGRGGMATVYEAERADGVFEQRVALKLLRRGLDTDEIVHRFLAERQILSALAHPHIARLLDGGATDEGRPYLVMERVAGEPITTAADRRRLDLHERLELFLQVADAVQFAHRRLVIHRDLKPSNVMVNDAGQAVLLDFGIAKLLDPGAEAGEMTVTRTGARLLTPEYASPEQLRGEPVTTASDVFQLGALLYVLLTGHRPFPGRRGERASVGGETVTRPSDVTGSGSARAASTTAQDDPTRSSPAEIAAARRTTPEGLRRALRGDLDAIVLKTLRPEPEERYSSVDAFADDLRRFVGGRPVRARRGSAAYRARKFLRRHWPVATAAMSFLVLGAGWLISLQYQHAQTVRERDRAQQAAQVAEREAATAQQVTQFLTGLFRSSDPFVALGDTVTALSILDRGVARIRTELQDQPGVRAALLEAMGSAFSGLGRYDRADTLLKESLVLLRNTYGPGHERVARVLETIGVNLREARDFIPADTFLHRALALRLADPATPDSLLTDLLVQAGSARRDVGDADSAVVLVNRALRIRERDGDTASATYVTTLGALAYVLRAAGAMDSAEVVYRAVLQRQRQLLGSDAVEVAYTLNNLGFLLRTRGDYGSAARLYREALGIMAARLGAGHPTTLIMRSNLASALNLDGDFAEVERTLQEQITAAEQQWPDGHWRVGSAYEAYGRFLIQRGRAKEALPALQAGLRSWTHTLGPQHSWTGSADLLDAVGLLLAGRTAAADAAFDAAYRVLQPRAGHLDRDTRTRIEQAATMLEAHRQGERIARFRRLLEAG